MGFMLGMMKRKKKKKKDLMMPDLDAALDTLR